MITPEEEAKSLTVGTLISILQMYDPEWKVVLEGCDCDGYLGGVTSTEIYGKRVAYLERIVV